MKLTAGAMAFDPRDPDCDLPAPERLALAVDGKSLQLTEGAKRTVITSQPDNSLKVETWEGNGDGTSQYTAATLSAPDSGSGTGGVAVTGFSAGRVVGEGALTGGGAGESPAGAGDDHCGSPGQPPCKIDETGTPTGSTLLTAEKADLVSKTPSSFGITGWSGDSPSPFSSLPSFGGDDSCVNPISWTLMGHTIEPDMCAVWGPLKPMFAWLLYALTALYIWRSFVAANAT